MRCTRQRRATHWLGGSWYRNSPLTGNWEDHVAKDVVRYVDTHFRTIAASESRAIAGHGMGGTGALELALKYPDMFSSVYALSPGLFDANGLQDAGFLNDSWLRLWHAQVQAWRLMVPKAARRSFRDLVQSRLNQWDRALAFQGLIVSHAAAVSPDLAGPYPNISFPTPGLPEGERLEFIRRFESAFGGWSEKLAVYRLKGHPLTSITLEHGGEGEYEWIQRGTKHVSDLMRLMDVTNTLAAHQGGHDSGLGRRLEFEMLPAVSRALKPAPE